ncbi:hypothetical protein DPEC_G00363950 [Dallia pectoralis]|nr:hypothetical protein DPEC_G00363950 [Dallia pectoralis]
MASNVDKARRPKRSQVTSGCNGSSAKSPVDCYITRGLLENRCSWMSSVPGIEPRHAYWAETCAAGNSLEQFGDLRSVARSCHISQWNYPDNREDLSEEEPERQCQGRHSDKFIVNTVEAFNNLPGTLTDRPRAFPYLFPVRPSNELTFDDLVQHIVRREPQVSTVT